MGEPIWIRCEGSDCPTHNLYAHYGTCSMCGMRVLASVGGVAYEHQRRDLLAMIERGDFDADPSSQGVPVASSREKETK